MDKSLQIQLHSKQNIASVNTDEYNKIELTNKLTEINEYDIRNVVSATEIFDAERAAYPIYRIYGRMEYMSLLNGLKNQYTKFSDFFYPQTTNSKNILNSFNFYLVRPASSGYTQVGGVSTTITPDIMVIDEKFDNWVTASPTNYPAGWIASVTTNSYMQQVPTNRAEFVLDNQFIFSTPFNFISMRKNLLTVEYGDFVLETNISISSLVIGTDMLTISVFSNSTVLYSFQTLATSAGYKQYTFSVPSSTPITHVSIFANSSNKSIFMDYFKLYKPGGEPVAYNTNISYIRTFEVIATPSDFDLYPIGFATNVYGEQAYAFNFNKDFNVSSYFDNFGFPVTELFLYAEYKKSTSPNPIEILEFIKWDSSGIPSKSNLNAATLNIGDYVKNNVNELIGDLIEYSKSEFLQVQSTPQTFYITTPYVDNSLPKRLIWKYNPFIPFRLRYFSGDLYQANIASTSYELVNSIPIYATEYPENTGNFIWREINPEGYTDPLTGLGTDYPFVNKRRYLFASIVLNIIPDLSDGDTLNAFSEVWFSRNAVKLGIQPVGDINNIGKPCR
jgi:hypothetical protein